MKITKVTPYPFYAGPKNLMLCRVDTDEGVYGWGEAYVVQGKEKAVQIYIEAMAPYMIGRSPFEIKHSATAMFDDFAIRRSSCDFFAAWSAIEIAMWDIMGKVCGQPVYNLLGGPCREKIRVYANGWWGGAKNIPLSCATICWKRRVFWLFPVMYTAPVAKSAYGCLSLPPWKKLSSV